MHDEPLTALLRTLEQPRPVDPDVAEALFARLRAETSTARPQPAPRRAWRWGLAPVAASLVLAVMVAVAVVVSQEAAPRSALAAVNDARSRFADMPPFEATVVRRTPAADLSDLPADLDTTGLPDLVVERRVAFRDPRHWRVTVESSSYSSVEEPLRAVATYDSGDFSVTDGELLGHYVGRSNRFLLSPLDETAEADLIAIGTASLAPRFDQDVALLSDDDLTRRCVVGDDAELLRRRTSTILCRSMGLTLNVDAETGLLLRLEKVTDDRGARLGVPHVIEVTDLTVDAAIDDEDLSVSAPAGARPVWVGQAEPPPALRVPAGGDVVATIDVGRVTTAVAAGPEGVFVLANDQPIEAGAPPPQRLVRIEPETSAVTWSVDVDRDAGSLALRDGVVWVGGARIVSLGTETAPQRNESFVARYTADTGAELGQALRIPGSTDSDGLAVDDQGRVWFTGGPVTLRTTGGVTEELGTLVEVTTTGTLGRRVPLPGRPVAVTAAEGAVWVSTETHDSSTLLGIRNEIVRVDPRRATVTALPTTLQAGAVAVAAGGAWVTSVDPEGEAGLLQRIDLRTGTAAPAVRIGFAPRGLLAAAGALWLVDGQDAVLRRVDPSSGAVVATLRVGGSPLGLTHHDRSLWVTDLREGTVKEIRVR